MYTIAMLRRTLGLASDNQVRNRLESIKDLLSDQIRRGPNNQIFLTEAGLGLLRRLQEYHETGLTLSEASRMMNITTLSKSFTDNSDQNGFVPNGTKQETAGGQRTEDRPLRRELQELKADLASLRETVRQMSAGRGDASPSDGRWWLTLREDIDVP